MRIARKTQEDNEGQKLLSVFRFFVNRTFDARDSELKRKKQAEILIPNTLPIMYLLDIICFSRASQAATLAILGQFGIKKRVTVNPGWYFRNSGSEKP